MNGISVFASAALLVLLAVVGVSADGISFEGEVRDDPDAASKMTEEKQKQIQTDLACEACHAFLDSFYQQLNNEFQERKKRKAHHKVLELPSDQVMWATCDGMLKSDIYGPQIISMCREFMAANRNAIAKTFEMKFEVSDNVEHFFRLKSRLCNAVKPSCVPQPNESKPETACSACQGLMHDVQRIASWGVGRANFGTKPHLFRALDDLCLSIPVRHPLHGRMKYFETCADLMDEYSGAIVDSIRHTLTKPARGEADPAKAICVEKAKLCKKTQTGEPMVSTKDEFRRKMAFSSAAATKLVDTPSTEASTRTSQVRQTIAGLQQRLDGLSSIDSLVDRLMSLKTEIAAEKQNFTLAGIARDTATAPVSRKPQHPTRTVRQRTDPALNFGHSKPAPAAKEHVSLTLDVRTGADAGTSGGLQLDQWRTVALELAASITAKQSELAHIKHKLQHLAGTDSTAGTATATVTAAPITASTAVKTAATAAAPPPPAPVGVPAATTLLSMRSTAVSPSKKSIVVNGMILGAADRDYASHTTQPQSIIAHPQPEPVTKPKPKSTAAPLPAAGKSSSAATAAAAAYEPAFFTNASGGGKIGFAHPKSAEETKTAEPAPAATTAAAAPAPAAVEPAAESAVDIAARNALIISHLKRAHAGTLYRNYDTDCNGTVNYSDFRTGLRTAGVRLTPTQFDQLVHHLDKHRRGEISYLPLLPDDLAIPVPPRHHPHAFQKELHLSRVLTARDITPHSYGYTLIPDTVGHSHLPDNIVAPQRAPEASDVEPAGHRQTHALRLISAKMHHSTPRIFHALRSHDHSASGYLSRAQFRAALRSLGISLDRHQMMSLVQSFDRNGKGVIDYAAFTQRLEMLQHPDTPNTVLAGGTIAPTQSVHDSTVRDAKASDGDDDRSSVTSVTHSEASAITDLSALTATAAAVDTAGTGPRHIRAPSATHHDHSHHHAEAPHYGPPAPASPAAATPAAAVRPTTAPSTAAGAAAAAAADTNTAPVRSRRHERRGSTSSTASDMSRASRSSRVSVASSVGSRVSHSSEFSVRSIRSTTSGGEHRRRAKSQHAPKSTAAAAASTDGVAILRPSTPPPATAAATAVAATTELAFTPPPPPPAPAATAAPAPAPASAANSTAGGGGDSDLSPSSPFKILRLSGASPRAPAPAPFRKQLHSQPAPSAAAPASSPLKKKDPFAVSPAVRREPSAAPAVVTCLPRHMVSSFSLSHA